MDSYGFLYFMTLYIFYFMTLYILYITEYIT